jgi:hypothetical protein
MSKMVQTGAYVGPIVVIEKILRQRPDVLGSFLDRCWFEKGIDILIDAVEEASETKYKAMIALIRAETGDQAREENKKPSLADEGSWQEKGADVEKKWWQR